MAIKWEHSKWTFSKGNQGRCFLTKIQDDATGPTALLNLTVDSAIIMKNAVTFTQRIGLNCLRPFHDS